MKKIFIVEDDRDIRELVSYLLVSQNYSVQGFADAKSFREVMLVEHPDLVLLDVMLPDGNGSEICKDLKFREETKNIPVVLMSAHADRSGINSSCAQDFISKPFEVEDFLERVSRQLN